MRLLVKKIVIFYTLSLITGTVTADSRWLASGEVKEVYDKNCASCHGKQLEGGMAASMLDDTWKTDGSDEALFKAIKLGMPTAGMPAWNQQLDDKQIRALVTFIKESKYLANSRKKSVSDKANVYTSELHNFKVETLLKSDNIIWAFDFLPNGDLIYTEREGNLMLFSQGKPVKIKNTPKVWVHGQGGLLDVRVDPDYQKNGWIYISYSELSGKNEQDQEIGSLTVARGKINNNQWQKHTILYTPEKAKHVNRGWHFGSRFAFQGDYLFFSLGDEGQQDLAQSKEIQSGKIHRIFKDGRIPKDNPFVNEKASLPTIWTYGNRNPQGLAEHPVTGEIWSTEHGPRGGDELNLILKGVNYGWPKVSFGINYNGTPLTPHTSLPGMQSPIHQWTPSIAVAGINFYTGDQFPGWKNDLFVSSLAFQELRRLRLNKNKVVSDEVILKGLGRIRDVATGPEGDLYIAINQKSDNENRIVKLSPSKP
ncbi:MAG: PQQ-dependent sugar dehydrogenase [Pseudomonadota bacterium]